MRQAAQIAASTHNRARRRRLLLAVPVVVAAGLLARFGLGGFLADASGGLLYTALLYVLVAAAVPMAPPPIVAAGAIAVSVAVELFQLTGVPAELNDAWSPLRLIFGTSFSAADLPAYLAGGIVAAAIDLRVTTADGARPRRAGG